MVTILTSKVWSLQDFQADSDMTDDLAFTTYTRYRLGWTLEIAEKSEEALVHLARAREGYGTLDDLLGAARCDHYAANALSHLGRLDEAVEIYRRVRSVFDACGSDDDTAVVDANLASAVEAQGDYTSAAAICRQIVERAREQGEMYLVGTVSTRLAGNLLKLNHPDEAMDAIEEAATYFSDRQDLLEGSKFLVAKARTLRALNRLDEARSIALSVTDRLSGTTLIGTLAEAYAILAACEEADGNAMEGQRLQAQAIALYLADGQDDVARELSKVFLPSNNEVAGNERGL
jgi:tetratricopeptide (TPR) repeat protein